MEAGNGTVPFLGHEYSVADPDPGSVNNQDPDRGSESGMNALGHISDSLETIFWVKILIRDGKNSDPGSSRMANDRIYRPSFFIFMCNLRDVTIQGRGLIRKSCVVNPGCLSRTHIKEFKYF
jgi:hypothetical protein